MSYVVWGVRFRETRLDFVFYGHTYRIVATQKQATVVTSCEHDVYVAVVRKLYWISSWRQFRLSRYSCCIS